MCSASWASLEADEGNLYEARQLLQEGLDLHPGGPSSVGVLVVLAKVERLEGNLEEARRLLDRAAKVSDDSGGSAWTWVYPIINA